MEQQLGLGAKAKTPLSGNHSTRKMLWPRSLPVPVSPRWEVSVGLREEVSLGLAAEEALRTCQFQMASAGAPGTGLMKGG